MFLTKKDHGEKLFVLPIDYKFVLILFSTFLIMYGKRMEREREKSYSNITKGEMQFKKRGGRGEGEEGGNTGETYSTSIHSGTKF